jgi:Mn2+/Fe2+ NRAMP family transporter
MIFVVALIYAGTILLCVGTTAWLLRAWTRRRYWHKSPSDLHYIVIGTALLLSAGIGVLVASQIVMVLGQTG